MCVVLQSQKVPFKVLLAACSKGVVLPLGEMQSSLMVVEGIYVILLLVFVLEAGLH